MSCGKRSKPPTVKWAPTRRGTAGYINRVQVVPITSNVVRTYPCEAAVEINGEPRKAMADQIATVSKLRLKSKLGTLTDGDMRAVEHAIRVQLGL